MKSLFLLISVSMIALTGCSVKPYASVSAGYNLQEKQSASYSDKCNMPAGFEVGGEHRSGWSAGVRHESNYDCGPYSWNPSRQEYWRDQVFVKYKFGGYK